MLRFVAMQDPFHPLRYIRGSLKAGLYTTDLTFCIA